MRASILVLLLSGCVVDADLREPDFRPRIELVDEPIARAPDRAPAIDVCALAAELPADDVCSLMCDPTALARRLVDDGMATGRCYQLRCALTASEPVLVGVCLP